MELSLPTPRIYVSFVVCDQRNMAEMKLTSEADSDKAVQLPSCFLEP